MKEENNLNEKSSAKKIKKVNIHTMPSKFYLEDKKSGGGNKFLIIGIIVIVALLLGVGGYFIFQKSGDENSNANINTAASNQNQENVNNTNEPTNVNIDSNVNSTVNANTNSNANSGNVNLLNIFENINVSTNTVLNVNQVSGSIDSDLDGLTDIEESLYGAKISNPDSDSDGFSDGQEVLNGYDPISSGRIIINSAISAYENSQELYSIYYPAVWTVGDDPQNQRGKMFTTSGEFVTVTVYDNPTNLSARDWYVSQSPGIDTSGIITINNWENSLSGIKSPDGMTVYYTKGGKAYVLSYNINILSEAGYKYTFEMMYKSFDTISSASINTNSSVNLNTNGNSNTNSNVNSDYLFNINSGSNTNYGLNGNLNTNTNYNTNTNGNSNNSNSQ